MNSKRWITAGATLLALAIILLAIKQIPSADASTVDESSAPHVSFAVAQKAPISNNFSVAGEFIPYQEVELHAKVAGYIRKINVDIGDRVHAGQVLAVLEIPELSAQVQGAEASVRHNQEEITRAQHELASAEAVHSSLHAAAVRLKQASDARPGLIAAQELDDAEGRDHASEAQVEAAKSSLSAARQQLDVSKADNLHYSALSSYANITAPFSGVITWRYSDTGSLVQSGTSSASSQPVVKLAQVDTLRLRLPVPESVAAFVHPGTEADIRVQATGEHFKGAVSRLAENFDRTTRTMQVEIDVPNKQGRLTPGMYADVTLATENRPDAITVPVQALIVDGEKSRVMVVTPGNQLEERTVKTGIESANAVEIVSGLNAGERVVVGNPRSFQPGGSVQPVPEHVSNTAQGGQ